MKIKKEGIALLIIVVCLVFIIIFFNNIFGIIAQDISSVYDEIGDYVPGEIIVKYRDGVKGNGNEIISNGKRVVYEFVEKPESIEKIDKNSELYKLDFDIDISNNEVNSIIKEYSDLDEVEFAEPNYIMRSFLIPNDANYNLLFQS